MCNAATANEYNYIDALLSTIFYTPRVRHNISEYNAYYLILIPVKYLSKEIIKSEKNYITIKLSFCSRTTLRHYISINEIYLLSESRKYLELNRKEFENQVQKFLNKNMLECAEDLCSCNEELFAEVVELKKLAFETVQEVWTYARDLGQYVLNGRELEDLHQNESNSLNVTLLQAWKAAFEVFNLYLK